MAKIETKVKNTNSKKGKAKKRKYVSGDNEEEVASKSFILAPAHVEPAEPTPKTKTLKRKHDQQDKAGSKEKRTKVQEASAVASEHESAAAEDLHEPTLAELQECEKPENKMAIVTVRQKKKQKHKQRLEAQLDQTGEREKQRNAEYLQKWKHARDQWKFEKLRQISIQQNVFDEDKIEASLWPIALEYLSGSKGAAKEKIMKLAEQCIDELDKQGEAGAERQEIVNSCKYQRARDLLQSFA